MGRIAEGLDADLILVADNPLVNIVVLRAPMGVMLRGKWISAADIQSRLDVIANKYKNL
jgi:imidazolonepropionase-like amidohydrolase